MYDRSPQQYTRNQCSNFNQPQLMSSQEPRSHSPRQRKQRSDAGQPQLTKRDLLILPWIALCVR